MTGRWAIEYLDNGMSRRGFLKAAAGTAATVAALGTLGCVGTGGPSASPAITSVAPATSIAPASPGTMIVARDPDPVKLVDRALDAFGGLSGIVKKGDNVVVKANFTFKNIPESSNHPQVLARLMQRCAEAGAGRVTAIDFTIDNPDLCLAKSGIKTALDAAGLKAVDLLNHAFVEKPVNGIALKTCRIAQDLLDADVFINAPVIKSHGSTRMTASMKNLMGVIKDRGAFHSSDLDQCIADLAGYLRPSLIVADAYRVLRTDGPQGNAKSAIDYPHSLIVGRDPVAVDAYAASFLGLKPEDVAHIMDAYRLGLGEYDLSKVSIQKVG